MTNETPLRLVDRPECYLRISTAILESPNVRQLIERLGPQSEAAKEKAQGWSLSWRVAVATSDILRALDKVYETRNDRRESGSTEGSGAW